MEQETSHPFHQVKAAFSPGVSDQKKDPRRLRGTERHPNLRLPPTED